MKTSFNFYNRITRKGSEFSTWEPTQVVWFLMQLNKPNRDAGLGPDAEPPASFMPGRFTPGSMETPWTMNTIEQWRGAADQEITSEPDTGLYEVGGVLLERNPSVGEFNNYDVTAKIERPFILIGRS